MKCRFFRRYLSAVALAVSIALLIGITTTANSQTTTALLAQESGVTGSIIFQDNFDSENNGRGRTNYATFTNWDVLDGTVDLIGNKLFGYYPGNGLYVDLAGTSWDPGLFKSKEVFDLAPGSYQLQFYLGGSQRNVNSQVTVEFGNIYSETFTIPTDFPLTAFTRTFDLPSASSGRLSFQNDGGGNIGAILDNVLLSKGSSTLPPPGEGF